MTGTIKDLFFLLNCKELEIYFPAMNNDYEYGNARGKIFWNEKGFLTSTCYCDINDKCDFFDLQYLTDDCYKVTAFTI